MKKLRLPFAHLVFFFLASFLLHAEDNFIVLPNEFMEVKLTPVDGAAKVEVQLTNLFELETTLQIIDDEERVLYTATINHLKTIVTVFDLSILSAGNYNLLVEQKEIKYTLLLEVTYNEA